MAITTTSNNTSHLWSYFKRVTLDVVKSQTVFMDLGDPSPLPDGMGKQVIWTKIKRLPDITAATTEGTPPTPIAITSAQVTAAVSQYKDAIQWSDFWQKTNANSDVESVLKERVAEQMSRSLDIVTRNALTTDIGTTYYANNAGALSSLDSGDDLTLGDIRSQKLVLEANDVGPHKSGYYVFVGHPNTIYDMKSDTATGGWIDVHKYTDAGRKQLFNAEVGEVDMIKIKSTTLISKTNSGTSGSAYAYTNFLFGMQPFGVVDLGKGNKALNIYAKGFGSAGTADPVDELATLGWKAYYVAKYFGDVSAVSDPDRAIKIVSGRTA